MQAHFPGTACSSSTVLVRHQLDRWLSFRVIVLLAPALAPTSNRMGANKGPKCFFIIKGPSCFLFFIQEPDFFFFLLKVLAITL
jgi:hypothetical protein